MFTVSWPSSHSPGYTDVLEESLFYSTGKIANVIHLVRHPKNSKYSFAICDLTVKRAEAILDYRPYSETNNGYGWYLGEMKLKFTDRTRTRISEVLWRDQGTNVFYRCGLLPGYQIEDPNNVDSEIGNLGTPEGKLHLRMHLLTERSAKLVAEKKAEVLKKLGCLRCEICEFDFAASYIGVRLPYAEVHHLDSLGGGQERQTTLRNLAVLCANCHRMIHRTEPMLKPSEFKKRCLVPRSS